MTRAGESAPGRAGAGGGGEEPVGCEHPEACITCGDEARQLRVVALDLERGLALCEGGDGAQASVEVALVAPVAEGDVLLVHAGTALANLGEEPAA